LKQPWRFKREDNTIILKNKSKKKLYKILAGMGIGFVAFLLLFTLFILICEYFTEVGVAGKFPWVPDITWARSMGTILSAIGTITLGAVAYIQNAKMRREREKSESELNRIQREFEERNLRLQNEKLLGNYYTLIKFVPHCKVVDVTGKKKKLYEEDVRSTWFSNACEVDPKELFSGRFLTRSVELGFEITGRSILSKILLRDIIVESIDENPAVLRFVPVHSSDGKSVAAPFFAEPDENQSKEETYTLKLKLAYEIPKGDDRSRDFWADISKARYWRLKARIFLVSVFNVVLDGQAVITISNDDARDDGVHSVFSSYFSNIKKPYAYADESFDENFDRDSAANDAERH